MKKTLAIVLIVLGAVILAAGILVLLITNYSKNHIMDGPGMVYSFRSYNLVGEWTEISGTGDKLVFTEKALEYEMYGEKNKSAYEIEEDGFFNSEEEGERKITLTENSFCECLIYHEQEIDGNKVPIISVVEFEYDGRGPVIFGEFVKAENAGFMPENFESELKHKYNDRDAGSSYMLTPSESETNE